MDFFGFAAITRGIYICVLDACICVSDAVLCAVCACRVEGEDREVDQSLLAALESVAVVALGANWGAVMPPELISNLGAHAA